MHELQKRKIYEHELEEKKKEEEKKMKQVMELINSPNNNLISWDDEGRFVSIKQMKETDFKKFPEPKQNVIHNKIEYDNQKIYDLDKNGRQKKFDRKLLKKFNQFLNRELNIINLILTFLFHLKRELIWKVMD